MRKRKTANKICTFHFKSRQTPPRSKCKHLFGEQNKENKAKLFQNCPAGSMAIFEIRNLERNGARDDVVPCVLQRTK
jgi:hypothetical protein